MTAGRPSAALLITGQELLLGLVADANTRFLAHELDALGIELRRVSIVGDFNMWDRRSHQMRKHIPAGGGLGGGSADAAAALLAVRQLLDIDVDAGADGRSAPRLLQGLHLRRPTR